MSEHEEQVALMEWSEWQGNITPELKLLFAIPNGGARHWKVGVKMRREGAKAGVPDLFLPVARRHHNGLFIEMKFGKNKPTAEQQWWLTQLEEESYCVAVCHSFAEAKETIETYLGIESP